MIYILIAFIFSSDGPIAATSVEFKSLEACQAAAKAIKTAANNNFNTNGQPILVCAVKG